MSRTAGDSPVPIVCVYDEPAVRREYLTGLSARMVATPPAWRICR
jgi:hypothetical protein